MPPRAARVAGLRYVNPDEPGIGRRRAGGGFVYTNASGRIVRDRRVLERIRTLAIPPAWSDVWICPAANGHIQATGRDARGRKQYRYHERWRLVRDGAKFEHLIEFAAVLPALRRRVEAHLRRRDLSREKVLAAVVRMLDLTLIRVGNAEYARDNQSFGLTTLRGRHVSVKAGRIEIRFRGKSGVRRHVVLRDRRLATIVRRCQALPGQDLFAWVDADGRVVDVTSSDVNAYLREVTGSEITSKNFRTWSATVAAAVSLQLAGTRPSQVELERCVVAAIERTAALLGNTPAVCRRSYVHPQVIDAYLEGLLCGALSRCYAAARRKKVAGLDPAETMVMRFLTSRAAAA